GGFADEHRRKPGRPSGAPHEGRDVLRHLRAYARRDRLAVDDLCAQAEMVFLTSADRRVLDDQLALAAIAGKAHDDPPVRLDRGHDALAKRRMDDVLAEAESRARAAVARPAARI